MFRIVCMGIGYDHEPDFEIDRRDGYPHYLALLVRTPCRMRCGDEIRSYPANTFVLYDVNVPQYYAADGVPYTDDWVQFESDPKIIRSFGLPLNEPIMIPDWTHPEYYFTLICSAFFRGFNSDTVINSLFTAMLTDFSVVRCAAAKGLACGSAGRFPAHQRVLFSPHLQGSLSHLADAGCHPQPDRRRQKSAAKHRSECRGNRCSLRLFQSGAFFAAVQKEHRRLAGLLAPARDRRSKSGIGSLRNII